jgi:phosphatidate phosphatase LPIN
LRKPEVFKMSCLRDLQHLYAQNSSKSKPFYAGFGNRITDALSYRSVGIPSSRIFTINSNAEVRMELLELAGYRSSYIHMSDLVDHFFPPVRFGANEDEEFTDLRYWKVPLPEISDESEEEMEDEGDEDGDEDDEGDEGEEGEEVGTPVNKVNLRMTKK